VRRATLKLTATASSVAVMNMHGVDAPARRRADGGAGRDAMSADAAGKRPRPAAERRADGAVGDAECGGPTGHRITHRSEALGGDEIVVSGAVLVPPGPPPGGWPVVSWAHGTTESADTCAPSRYPDFRGIHPWRGDG
jgi:hypothetical protein